MIEKNILFFWIPKTAGTSISHAFKEEGCQSLRFKFELANFKNQGFVTFGHVNIFKLVRENIISEDFLKNAFKFTFVRNPWERLVSLFFYRKNFYRFRRKGKSFSEFCKELEKRMIERKKKIIYHEIREKLRVILIKLLGSKLIFKFAEKNKTLIYSINIFLRNRLNNDNFSRFKVPPVGLYNSKGLSQANPQVDWITDENGKINLDFVGKFENLESDFKKLKDILGIKAKLPHLTKSVHENYREYYNEQTKKIVERLYFKDISYFNYTF